MELIALLFKPFNKNMMQISGLTYGSVRGIIYIAPTIVEYFYFLHIGIPRWLIYHNHIVSEWMFVAKLDIFMENTPYCLEHTGSLVSVKIFKLTFKF